MVMLGPSANLALTFEVSTLLCFGVLYIFFLIAGIPGAVALQEG